MRLIDADALKRKAQKEATTAWKMRLTAKVETVVNQFIDWLDAAPTIEERKTGRWIPCSERLPEDSQFVLMTIRRMDEHYNHEPFISVGYISWNQSAWWCAHDGDCKSNDVRVDAWMPLPEPYGGEQE